MEKNTWYAIIFIAILCFIGFKLYPHTDNIKLGEYVSKHKVESSIPLFDDKGLEIKEYYIMDCNDFEPSHYKSSTRYEVENYCEEKSSNGKTRFRKISQKKFGWFLTEIK